MEIEVILKKRYEKNLVQKILLEGLKQNFFYGQYLIDEGSRLENFRPISLEKAAYDLIEGNIDEMNAIYIKVEDTFMIALILEESTIKDHTAVIISGLFAFWNKEFLNKPFGERNDLDFPRYFRTLLRWLKNFDIVDFILRRDSDDRDSVLDVGDESRFISIDFDLRDLKKGDELKHFYTNSLIHGYEFTDNKENKVEFEEIKKALDAKESLNLYFTAQGYPIELRMYGFSVSLKPLEPFKKVSKEDEELLLDWPFYIEVALQLVEGFWINDFRII
jgi:hypothetical protein